MKKLVNESLNEGFATEEGRNLDRIASWLGYDDLHEMLGDNPGLYDSCIEWIESTFESRRYSEMVTPEELEEVGLYEIADMVRERNDDYERDV